MSNVITTLFMLMSVDGKISTGSSDELDVDQDFPHIPGIKEGLHQYYEIEACSDLWSLNTGRVMEKLGINQRTQPPKKMNISFVILDSKPHLSTAGIQYLCSWVKQLVLVTSNPQHPAFSMQESSLSILYQEKLDLSAMLEQLHTDYGMERLTIQSGGTLNGAFLHEKLFDYVDIVIAPALIGGKSTPTLIDGASNTTLEELTNIAALQLISCEPLQDSYIRLRYQVIS